MLQSHKFKKNLMLIEIWYEIKNEESYTYICYKIIIIATCSICKFSILQSHRFKKNLMLIEIWHEIKNEESYIYIIKLL